MDNPVGGIKRGGEQIRSVYERLFNSQVNTSSNFITTATMKPATSFMSWAESEGSTEPAKWFCTWESGRARSFRRIDGEWRQIPHHGSIEDSQLLAAYVCLRDWRLCRAKPTFVISRVKTFPILKSCIGWQALIRNSHIEGILPLTCRAAVVASFRGQIAPRSVYSELSDVSAVTLLARFASHSRMSREHFSDSTRFRWWIMSGT